MKMFEVDFNGHTLTYGSKIFKWDGKAFHVYKKNRETQAYELIERNEEPVLRHWLGIHTMKIYMKAGKMRVYVFSEYTGRKLDYIDYPIIYSDGRIAWDNPFRIPHGIRERMERTMKLLWQEGAL
jgi:hypothetical protein